MSLTLSWPYIAGFFDGEGSCSITLCNKVEKRSPRLHKYITPRCGVAITQKDPRVLELVHQKLLEEGIPSKLKCDRADSTRARPNSIWNLILTDYEAQYKFLNAIRPFAIVKLASIDKCLEFLESRPRFNTHVFHNAGHLSKLYWEEKLSVPQIAEQLHVAPTTIYSWMRKAHIPLRDRKEHYTMFNKQRKETMGREKTIKPNRSEKRVSPDASEIILEKIEYYRQKRPPTLSQYIYRRAVKQKMAEIKGKVGVTVNPGTGIPIPESALAAQEALKGLTAEQILKEHPLWAEEYYEKYGKP